MELNQTSICYYDKRLARISTCTESTDSIVPDTFPDIGRVVCAYGTAAVKDQGPQSGRLLISGTVQATVLYEPESGDGLRRLSVPVSFAHIEECEGMDADAVCAVTCHAAAVDAVAVNSRKLNISVQLIFSIEGYCKTACEVTETVEIPHVELLSGMQTVTLVDQARAYPVTVLDDITMQDAAGLSLLHTSCTMRASECRAMHGKIVLKGEADIRCLAVQEDDAIRVLTSSTPFTQILEMPDAEEGDAVNAQLCVREADCRLEGDGLLSYTVSANAVICIRRTKAIRRIDDLYLPGKALQLQEDKIVLHSMPPLVPFTAEAAETLQTAQHVSHVVSAEAFCCGAKRGAPDELLLTAAVQVLYLGDDQQLCALQRMLPLTMPCTAAGEVSQIELSARASSAGEKGILLSVTAAGMAAAEEHCTFRHITAAEAGEPQQDRSGVTLLLRYVDKEQPLWDIAKSCGTTMDAIRQANELAADVSSVAGTMLLIPIQA